MIYNNQLYSMNRNYLFIINPISGVGKKHIIPPMIENAKKQLNFNYDILETEYAGHATSIAHKNANKYDVIVAVGGDGTVNEIAQGLVNTNAALGIIPCGSGNGLARHLGYPMNKKKALEKLLQSQIVEIDSIDINNYKSFNVAGIGFDAHIAETFANFGKRGLTSYIKIIFKEFFTYKNKNYKITIDNQQISTQAFMICICNSTQYGNNAYIAPHASINDGYVDICIVKRMPLTLVFYYGFLMMTKKLKNNSNAHQFYKVKSLKVETSEQLSLHVDGDIAITQSPLEIKVLPKSLKAIVCKKDI